MHIQNSRELISFLTGKTVMDLLAGDKGIVYTSLAGNLFTVEAKGKKSDEYAVELPEGKTIEPWRTSTPAQTLRARLKSLNKGFESAEKEAAKNGVAFAPTASVRTAGRKVFFDIEAGSYKTSLNIGKTPSSERMVFTVIAKTSKFSFENKTKMNELAAAKAVQAAANKLVARLSQNGTPSTAVRKTPPAHVIDKTRKPGSRPGRSAHKH